MLRHRLLTVRYKNPSGSYVSDSVNSQRDYVYDLAGNLRSVTEPGKAGKADVAYTYDGLRRQITETSSGLTHAYKYDLAGNRIGTTYGGGGLVLASTYDEQNRLKTVTEGGRTTAYTYDLNGNVLTKKLPKR